MHKGTKLAEIEGYGIIDCEVCEYIHIDPIPSKVELDRIYGEEYYTDEKPKFIERVIEDLSWWETVYDDRFDFLESRVKPGSRRLLDIGSGPGYFIQRGAERGWECMGVEPSRQAAQHARGLGAKVVNAFFDEATASSINTRFGAVHLSEVLEHVPDPEEVLKRAYGLLEPGGILCAIVPNDFSPVQKVLTDRLNFNPYWLAPPHHINYFTFASLSALMTRVGFDVLEQTSMFPMDFFLLMGDNYVGNDELGRASHSRRKQLDIMLNEPELKGFKKDLYSLMAKHAIGREMVIYGVKR